MHRSRTRSRSTSASLFQTSAPRLALLRERRPIMLGQRFHTLIAFPLTAIYKSAIIVGRSAERFTPPPSPPPHLYLKQSGSD